ncbi:MAG: ABC transporter, partial [Betaproteobacteria bacterium]|nr:ABC transporter [Betaproteobacteria bacterium]
MSVSLPPVPAADPAHASIAEPWRDVVAACLQAGERVLIALELDLDRRLRYGAGLVVLTDRALVAKAAGDADWHRHPLGADTRLELHDHAGAGALELFEADRRLDVWRFTLGSNPAALRLVRRFDELRGQSPEAQQPGAETST